MGFGHLSIELTANRKAGAESDVVAVILKLIKGDSGSLELQLA
jgi:hypothetical protein